MPNLNDRNSIEFLEFLQLKESFYYIFGNYLYNLIKPEITGDVEIFKYIVGKYYLDYLIK